MPDQLLKVTVPDAELQRLQDSIDPKNWKAALYQAVNRTTKAGVGIAIDEVQKTVNLTDKYARRAIKGRVATNGVPVGEIVITSQRIPLIAFKPKFSKSHGVTVEITKGKPPLVLAHAFKAKVKAGEDSSHTGVFTRAKGGGSSLGAGRKVAKSGFSMRLPIKQLSGPRIITLIDQPATEKAVLAQLGDRLEHEIDSQIARFTGQTVAAVSAAAGNP